jgi:hypothetical protein
MNEIQTVDAIATLISLIFGPFALTFVLLSIFGPNHCGSSKTQCKK